MNDQLNLNILVVEDNPIDALLIKRALKKAGVVSEPMLVDDGGPAISILRRDAPYQNAPHFELIILDLNLKRVDGPEVLKFIRSDPALAQTTVAIFSSSPEDVMRFEASQANCFFRKCNMLESILDLGRKMVDCFTRNKQAGTCEPCLAPTSQAAAGGK